MAEPYIRTRGLELAEDYQKIESCCSVFQNCGGCTYLNLNYEDELNLKEQVLRDLFAHHQLNIPIHQVTPSPRHQSYRNKLVPQIKKRINGDIHFGMAPFGKKQVVEISECPITLPIISDQIPKIHQELLQKDLTKIKRASLVLRSDGEKFHCGWWGKGSLKRTPPEYFQYHWKDKVIYYSLDTFFQANFFILESLIQNLQTYLGIDDQTHFYDLYGGVGLFAYTLGANAKHVTLIELEGASTQLAKYNKEMNQADHVEIICKPMEQMIPFPESPIPNGKQIAMIDPPRAGLSPTVIDYLSTCPFTKLAYLSCNPETQVRDLKHFIQLGWTVDHITPYDFFPRSYHIESLAILSPPPKKESS